MTAAAKEVDWSVDQARFFLSRFDAIVWSANVKNKSILMINAEKDNLINRPTSVDPLIVLSPMFNFIGENNTTPATCTRTD